MKTKAKYNYLMAIAAIVASTVMSTRLIHADVTGTNGADGTTPGAAGDAGMGASESTTGSTTVSGGDGGQGADGDATHNGAHGGDGGNANATASGTVSASATAVGGNGGGGGGNDSESGSAGHGGNGGSAIANATSTNTTGDSSAQASASPGNGGDGGSSEANSSPYIPAVPGDAGTPGGGHATATATSSSTGTATAMALYVGNGIHYGNGGNGGTGSFNDDIDSTFGDVSSGLPTPPYSLLNATVATANGGTVGIATVTQTGSAGGSSTTGNGTVGGASTLVSATGLSPGPSAVWATGTDQIWLTQQANGGVGGSGGDNAGGGGYATSLILYGSNTTPLTASKVYVKILSHGAQGGMGTGTSTIGGPGATALAGTQIVIAHDAPTLPGSSQQGVYLVATGGDGGLGSGGGSSGGDGIIGIVGNLSTTTGYSGSSVRSTGGGNITLFAEALGGTGGAADSGTAGSGGRAFLDNPIILSTTGNISAFVDLEEGSGGGNPLGGSATQGGNAANVTSVSNAFSVTAGTASTVTLQQVLHGGNGGDSGGSALFPSGVAGAANSTLVYSLGVNTLTLEADAEGGADLRSGAQASADAEATNTESGGTATATARADGGNSPTIFGTATAYASASANGVTLTKSVTTTDGTEAVAYVSVGASPGPNGSESGGGLVIGPTCLANSTYTQTGGSVTLDTLAIGDTSLTCPYAAVYNLQGGTLTVNTSTTINRTGTFNQTGGTASLANITGAGTISVASGTYLTAGKLSMHSGTVTANGTVTMTTTSATRQTADVAVEIGSLSVGTAGLFDLKNHDLIIHGGESLSQVQALINSAYNSGGWNGTAGITSSSLATHEALGYATAGELGISSFDGITVISTDIIVKFTYLGDANLDGSVNLTDENIVNNNLGSSNLDWAYGHFSYSNGTVSLTDLNDVNNNLGIQSSAGVLLLPAVAPTPEPASLLTIGLGALALISRRRQQR